MKTKTSELTGTALDWAVATCENLTLYYNGILWSVTKDGWWLSGLRIDPNNWVPLAAFTPSTNWSQGGPIIERAITKIEDYGDCWGAEGPDAPEMFGPTPLIAAMRCFVASRLGDEVEIPEELV